MAEQLAIVTVQWGVGQGGLNSQFVYVLRDDEWRSVAHVVYDCGGDLGLIENAVTSIIDLVKSSDHQKIDAVFISHVDKDHIGGVKMLLEELGKAKINVGDIFLPHLSILERLAVVIAGSAAPSTSTTNPRTGDVIEPTDLWDIENLFRELDSGVSVTELGSSDNASDEVFDSDRGEPIGEPYVETDRSRRGPIGEPYVETDRSRGRRWVRLRNPQTASECDAILWEWLPMVAQRATNWRQDVRQSIEANPVIQLPDLESLTTAQLQATLLDSSRREALVNELKKGRVINGGEGSDTSFSNISSIMLYAGPPEESLVGEQELHFQVVSLGWDAGSIFIGPWFDTSGRALPPGWLGTGDAELKRAASVTELTDFIGRRAEHVGVLSAPHHGSHRNSDYDFPDHFPNARVVTFEYGSGNSYGHPSSETIGACYSAGKIPVHLCETGGWVCQVYEIELCGKQN